MNRIAEETNEPEIILDKVVRKELGRREGTLSLRRTLFCPRKWTPSLSPLGGMSRPHLLIAVVEGVR